MRGQDCPVGWFTFCIDQLGGITGSGVGKEGFPQTLCFASRKLAVAPLPLWKPK